MRQGRLFFRLCPASVSEFCKRCTQGITARLCQGPLRTCSSSASNPASVPFLPGSGRAKKGGSGGKYTWGGLLEDEESGATDAVTDRRDPNYDSGEDGDDASQHVFWRDAARSEVAAFKAGVTAALAEFYGTGDLTEVAACLRDLGSPQYGYWVVKRAVVGALDRHDREREMTSVLLAALHGEVCFFLGGGGDCLSEE